LIAYKRWNGFSLGPIRRRGGFRVEVMGQFELTSRNALNEYLVIAAILPLVLPEGHMSD
jgi:hypothetical protein